MTFIAHDNGQRIALATGQGAVAKLRDGSQLVVGSRPEIDVDWQKPWYQNGEHADDIVG